MSREGQNRFNIIQFYRDKELLLFRSCNALTSSYLCPIVEEIP